MNRFKTDCTGQQAGFNYCLFAKCLIAVPAFSVVAYIPVLLFSSPVLQLGGAVLAIAFTLWAAIKLDHVPVLRKKICLSLEKQPKG